jgi:signal peptidase I
MKQQLRQAVGVLRNGWQRYRQWNRRRKERRRKPQNALEAAISWVRSLLGALVVVMIINGLAVASFVVPTGSMENTVMAGDFLFVNRLIFGPSTPQIIPFVNIPLPYIQFPGLRRPQRGDVIVFIFPGYRDEVRPREFQYYLKRCVAVAGDTLEIRNKRVFVNGVEQPLPPKALVTTLPPPPQRPVPHLPARTRLHARQLRSHPHPEAWGHHLAHPAEPAGVGHLHPPRRAHRCRAARADSH